MINREVLIITGPLAAYKSSLAKTLSQQFNIPLLCKDDIKETLFEQLSQSEASKRLSEKTFLMMLNNVKNHTKVILEANFKQHEYDALTKALKKQNRSFVTLYLYGQADILYQRYKVREHTRHEAHKAYGLMSLDQFKRSVQEHALRFYDHDLLTIDTSFISYQDKDKLTSEVFDKLNTL